MFQIFESNPNETKLLFDILKGVVVIDLLGYDPDIQSLIITNLLSLLHHHLHISDTPDQCWSDPVYAILKTLWKRRR